MKTLKNCIKLSCSVKIYVPSTFELDKNFDTTEWINKTLSLLANEFGGSTSSKALGAWLSNKGELVKEEITLVFSYATQDKLELSIDRIYEFCLDMKKNLAQVAIALEINNELYLI